MTQEEIQEYNKKCAEFLGWYKVINGYTFIEIISENEIEWLSEYAIYRSHDGKYHLNIDSCKFHSDWNWIMEVYIKIESLNYDVSIFTTDVSIKDDRKYIVVTNASKPKTKLEAALQAINQFLIFYNENNK